MKIIYVDRWKHMATRMSNTGDIGYNQPAGTIGDCDKCGHCWHQRTAKDSLWCCKCGKYQYPVLGLIMTVGNQKAGFAEHTVIK